MLPEIACESYGGRYFQQFGNKFLFAYETIWSQALKGGKDVMKHYSCKVPLLGVAKILKIYNNEKRNRDKHTDPWFAFWHIQN